MKSETDLRKIRARLSNEGWYEARKAKKHIVYKHPEKEGRVIVPKGRGDLPSGTADSIAEMAGW